MKRALFVFLIAFLIFITTSLTWIKVEYEARRDRDDFIIDNSIIEACLRGDSPAICISEVVNKRASAAEISIGEEIATWTFVSLLATITALFGTAIGLFWVRETLIATRDTADAAKTANDITRSSIETSERAWISSKIVAKGSVRAMEYGGWRLPIEVVNSNIGKTPAREVSTWVVASTISGIHHTIAAMKKQVDGQKEDDTGILVAPGDSYGRRWDFSTDMGDELRGPAKPNEEPDFIVAMVSYKTVFDDDRHHTISVYAVGRDYGHDNPMHGPVVDGLQPEELYFWPWNGSDAD